MGRTKIRELTPKVVALTTDSGLVRQMIAAPGVKLMSLSQADACTRLFPQNGCAWPRRTPRGAMCSTPRRPRLRAGGDAPIVL